ncbi:MAG: beta-propeller domain-containing protein [Polyangiaceae bacterium]
MSFEERTFTFLRRRPVLGAAVAVLAAACSSPSVSHEPRAEGQTDFVSSSPNGQSNGRGLTEGAADAAGSAGGSASSAPSNGNSSATPRVVEETDLYRLEGDRLYYLNVYRGLMVFDVSNVDAPRLLGRSPIYGYPNQMIVRNGVATVVLSDWYGKMDDGTPFHGAIVRGIDASDPSQMKILGEATLDGDVRDTRVVGDVLYAVTEKYPYYYGWGTLDGAVSTGASTQVQVGVSSVSFAGGKIEKKNSYAVPGSGGVFYVTQDAILLGHALVGPPNQYGYSEPTGDTALDYVDISDPSGNILRRGSVTFAGTVQGWGTDNGRWNIDFADQKTAHALACGGTYCGNGEGLVLATADFTNPDQPSMTSRVALAGNGWAPAVRFDGNRMYLSPANGYYYSGTALSDTPIQIYDLTNAAAPTLAGSVNVTGQLWNFTPSGDRLFALGNSYSNSPNAYGSQVDLHYLDVSNPAAPRTLGTASFGKGWAWTPAAGTFKAFTKSDSQGLVVLPFSGYDYTSWKYNNGLQLIEFTPNTIATSGAARTKGWVERGIFVKNRLVSLSDVSLAVVDYTDHTTPRVVTEVTLARNVVNATVQQSGNVAELSSDFWDNDKSTSELRVLDAARVEETTGDAALARLDIPGTNAQIFHNGELSYTVTQVVRRDACEQGSGKAGAATECEYWHTRVQVIDRSGDSPVLRGAIDLPENRSYNYWGWGWGWWGCYAWDWYYGAQTVQVAGNVLAFQTYEPSPDYSTVTRALVTVNLSDPDQPVMGRTTVIDNSKWWWGNLRAVGDRLYATHYEWVQEPFYDQAAQRYNPGSVRYFLDKIDISNPSAPRVGARINVPGILVGASEQNPDLIYTIDYRWYGDRGSNELAVSLLDGNRAYYQGGAAIPGYVGNVFVRGERAYFTTQEWQETANGGTTTQKLYQANLSDPRHPSVTSATPSEGWGWLLDVQGDRAFVQSGWGSDGLDVYKLNGNSAPTFDQTVRVRGWYTGSLSRAGNDVYLATGYWGTEHVTLK